MPKLPDKSPALRVKVRVSYMTLPLGVNGFLSSSMSMTGRYRKRHVSADEFVVCKELNRRDLEWV